MLCKWRPVSLALTVILLTVSCTFTLNDHNKDQFIIDRFPGILSTIPSQYLESVQTSLNEAGENAPELIKVLTSLKERELKWACFLIGTMPFPDLISIKADYLLEHIHYTSLAKDKYKWMRQIPEDVFLANVLPYRMSSEPIVPHRRYFFEQLDPLVKDCENVFEASYQVNLWLGGERKETKARVHFEPGEARNKSPFGTLLSGQGRCGELTIILVAAARSVGIPARSVFTPYWVKAENNHAWTEIWAEGKWYAMASGHPDIQSALAATAGRAWFTEAAATAAALYSERLGVPENPSSVYKASNKDSVINLLAHYSQTCRLDITVLAPDGKAASDTSVALSVINRGVFRKVAVQKTDADGRATITTGIGQYMLSAGDNDSLAWQIVSTGPSSLPVTLILAKGNTPSSYYTFAFPSTQEAYLAFDPIAANLPKNQNIPDKYKKINAEHSLAAPPEIYHYDEFKIEEHPAIRALIDQSPLSGSIVRTMKAAGGNWPELAAAIKEVPEEEKGDLLWLIATMRPVDAVESTREILLEHVKYAQLASRKLRVPIPETIYRSYVLSPYIPNMHVYQWRRELYERLIPLVTEGEKARNPADMALCINRWIEENIKPVEAANRRFFTVPNPSAVFESKRAEPFFLHAATVAALRSVGVPARVKSSWLEFYDGTDWAPLYPMDSGNLGNTEANEASKQEYAERGGVRAVTTKNGSVFSPAERNWGISRFSGGGWDLVKDESDHGWTMASPGNYLFTTAARNTNGDVLLYAQPIMVTSNRGMEITVPLDLPVEMLGTGERMVRKLDVIPDFVLKDRAGKSYDLRQLLVESNVLLVFFTLKSEPAMRMLPLVQEIVEKANASNVTILGILIDENKIKDERLNDISFPILLDKDMSVSKRFIPDMASQKNIMPSILLINKAGGIILWQEGYNMGIDALLVDAFDTLLGKKPIAATLKALNKKVRIREVDLAAMDYAKRGSECLTAGDYPMAVAYYKEALLAFPDIPEIWYNYACSLSCNNNIDEAFEALKKAIELGSNNFLWMKKDPDLENLRKDKRFQQILR